MRNRAFSLLELVISMAILSIALLGLIQMFPVGLKASKHAGDHTIMTFLGQQKMSDIEQEKPTGSTESNAFFPSPYESFSWRRAVSSDYNNINNLYHATLAIYSNDRGDTRIEEFITLYVK
jgi:prepilin-type N-terminal cleavage/methylation domain-containing protein